MKRKRVRKAPRRGPARLRWKPMGGLALGPFFGPSGDGAAVMIIADPKARGRYGVAGVGMPKETLGGGVQDFFDNHSHAVVADGVSLAEAKRLGEAWAKKFRKGIVLAPCACEDMVDAVARAAPGR